MQAQLHALERSHQSQLRLQTLYEETLSDATARIRAYVHAQQQHTIALHRHYTTLLQQSREETLEAMLRHQEWQAGLVRVSEEVRSALRAREEEGRPWRGVVKGLRGENRMLRRRVGWEVGESSGEEEDDGIRDGEDAGRGVGRRSERRGGAVGAGSALEGQEVV